MVTTRRAPGRRETGLGAEPIIAARGLDICENKIYAEPRTAKRTTSLIQEANAL
jgi:hypothetical protein